MSRSAIVLLLVPAVIVSSPVQVFACESRNVQINGNLNSDTAPISGTLPHPSEPIADQISAAQETIDVQIFDSRGVPHSIALLFFKVDIDATLPWVVRLIATDEAYSIPEGLGRVILDQGLTYMENGERMIVAPPDSSAGFNWNGGTRNENIDFLFVPTNLPAATDLTISQDGSESGCTQFGNLDFDGDGKDDFAVFRPSIGIWAILKSSVQQSEFIFKQWGLLGDYPMPGDHDGDGKADLVVWRPTDGNWYVCKSSTDFDCAQPDIIQFGLPGDIPLEGDFDADRILDKAVWRPSNGNFYYRSSRNTEVIERQWGLPGDIPLQGGRN